MSSEIPCKEAFVLACTNHVAVSIVCRWIEKDFYAGVCHTKAKNTTIPARLTYSHVEEVFLYPPTYNTNCYVIVASQNKCFFTRYFTQTSMVFDGRGSGSWSKNSSNLGNRWQQRISLNAWVLHAPSRCFFMGSWLLLNSLSIRSSSKQCSCSGWITKNMP